MAYLSTIKDGSSNDILAHHVSGCITLDIATTTIDKLMSSHKNTLHQDAFIQIRAFIIQALSLKHY